MSSSFHLADLLADAPLLSTTEAHLTALTLTSTYVGGLYLSRLSLLRKSKSPRSGRSGGQGETTLPDLVESDGTSGLDRDDPEVIRSRVKAVSLSTLAGIGLVGGIVYYRGNMSSFSDATKSTISHLGLPIHLPPLPSYPLPNPSTIINNLPSPSTIISALQALPSKLQAGWVLLKPLLLPYKLVPVLFSGSLLVEFLEKTLPGQMYGRRVLPRFLSSKPRSASSTSSGFEGNTAQVREEPNLFDLFHLVVPASLKRLMKGEDVDGVSKAVEQRRWIEMRNYIVGPITEEIVFRSCIITTYLLAGYSKRSSAPSLLNNNLNSGSGRKFLIFGTPLWFGIAHLHHAYEVYKKGGKTRKALNGALGSAAFQLTYTTLFGWYAAYLYIKTGSILPSIASHIFCNLMGFPDPVGAIESFPPMKGPIIGTYLAGIGGFAYGLTRL